MENMGTDLGLADDAFAIAFEAASMGETLADEVEQEGSVTTDVISDEAVEDATTGEVVQADVEVKTVISEPPKDITPVVDAKPIVPVVPVPDKAAEEAAAKLAAEAASRESLTEDEQAAISQAAIDFPDVVRAFEARERVMVAKFENLLSAKLAEVASQLDMKLAPALSITQDVARAKHEAIILAAHSDARAILPQVEEWVGKKPKFMQDAFNNVLDNGSADDVVELFNVFKRETGSAQAPPSNTEDIEQKAAKEKKLKSQESVKSRQAAQKGGIDESDFESAFNAAAK